MADIQTLHDNDQSDVIVWPADQRGRTVNWRMTPARAAEVAEALAHLPAAREWQPEINALREAAGPTHAHYQARP